MLEKRNDTSAQRELSTVVIEHVDPELDGGRYPVKREIGDRLVVSADIFKEGQEVLAAVIQYRTINETSWRERPMYHFDNDRWSGHFDLSENTRYIYTIAAYADTFESWQQELMKKSQPPADTLNEQLEEQPFVVPDLRSELLEGQALLEAAAKRAQAPEQGRLQACLKQWTGLRSQEQQIELALNGELGALVRHCQERASYTVYDRELEVVVDRPRARYGAWYEMFPRSQGVTPGRSATFKDCEARLGAIKAMGFDVVYLTPIHPIGRTNRKGRNNSLEARPSDPGSPYAIGNEHGGHDAVEPSLGTLTDFDRFVGAARERGMEIALDFAINCSPDHPYCTQHQEWFYKRPDGTIKYAENPPKKYEDIYNLNFYCEDWRGLWQEMKRVILFWVEHGVRIIRVDNPHTKPVPFWAWLISEVQAHHPDVLFLAEAFTRPKMMRVLAKAGFSQSYTYFTWRNFKQEITDYLMELTHSEMKEFFRPNFFTNTPDILPEILQQGGRPAFQFRLVLAATASPSYGIYSGYELCENRVLPGREEYRNSEKYEFKVWDWDRPGNIIEYITRVNQIRRDHPSLHEFENLRFYEADNEHILFYGKSTQDRQDPILVVINLNPFQAQGANLRIPLLDLQIGTDETYQLHNLLTDRREMVKGDHYWIQLDPKVDPAAIFAVRRWKHREQEFDCFY